MRDLAEVMISEAMTFTYYGEHGYITIGGLDIYVSHDGVYQIRDSGTDELVTYESSPYGVVGYLDGTSRE